MGWIDQFYWVTSFCLNYDWTVSVNGPGGAVKIKCSCMLTVSMKSLDCTKEEINCINQFWHLFNVIQNINVVSQFQKLKLYIKAFNEYMSFEISYPAWFSVPLLWKWYCWHLMKTCWNHDFTHAVRETINTRNGQYSYWNNVKHVSYRKRKYLIENSRGSVWPLREKLLAST